MLQEMMRLIAVWLLFCSLLVGEVQIGDKIINTAYATYTVQGVDANVSSNSVTLQVEGTEAKIDFMLPVASGGEVVRVQAGFYLDEQGKRRPLPLPQNADTAPFVPGSEMALVSSERYGIGDIAVIRLIDPDQNLDILSIEEVSVLVVSPTGDTETLILKETQPNSGIFTGFILLGGQNAARKDGVLWIEQTEKIEARYTDNGSVLKVDAAIVLPAVQQLKVWIEKKVDLQSASVSDMLTYTLIIHNDEPFEVEDLRLRDQMSLGLRMMEGSLVQEGGRTIEYVMSKDGKTFEVILPALPAKGVLRLRYQALITSAALSAQTVKNSAVVQEARALLDAKGFVSNEATVSTQISEELMRSKGSIVGQVYECKTQNQQHKKGISGVRLYLEDGVYVTTDRNGRYHFEGIKKGTHVIQIDTALLPDGYLLPDKNSSIRHADRRYSQFVLMQEGLIKRVDFCLQKDQNATNISTNSLKSPRQGTTTPKRNGTFLKQHPPFDKTMLMRHLHTEKIIWPPKEYIPPIPSLDIAFVHHRKHRFVVRLNGVEIDPIHYEGSIKDANATYLLERYKGVSLLPQTNTLEVVLKDTSGNIQKVLKRTIHVSQTPVRVEFVPEHSRLIADGKTPPVIAVRFYDAQGFVLRKGLTGTLSVEPPYQTMQKIDQTRINPLVSFKQIDNRYIVEDDGIARISLQPTTEAGMVTLRFNIMNREERVYAWLKPAMREWIMVGFVEGSVGYNTLKGHMQNIRESGAKEGVITEGRVKFFAKGAIKGKWLLTLAYDSGKQVDTNRLYQEIDPHRYYTLYQDATIQNYDAQSQKKLYVKLEKEQFRLLFGDFSTDLSITELTRYSRRLNGIKVQYNDTHAGGVLFGASSDQSHVRDELRGDGTSGYYVLRRAPLIAFSEKVLIEVRDRYRPNIVLSRTSLQRFRDYEIDYEQGRLYFKEPIYSTDQAFNPRYIVVDYEVRGEDSGDYTYGGRVYAQTADKDMEAGVSYIREEHGLSRSELRGIDIKWRIARETLVRAEVAQSIGALEGNRTIGDARFFELQHFGHNYFVRGYFQEQDHQFGLGQLSEVLGGKRLYGIDYRHTIDPRITWNIAAFRNEELASGERQDAFEMRLETLQTYWSAFLGYRFAKHSTLDPTHQLLLGGSRSFWKQKLKLHFTHEQNFKQSLDPLFATRTQVGFDVAMQSKVTLFGTFEWLQSATQKSRMGRIGLRYMPWSGMTFENTTLSEFQNDTVRIYNTMGALQQIQWDEHWSFSIGAQQGRLLEGNQTARNDRVDFSAYRLGINYRTGKWSATLNGEYRISDLERKYTAQSAIFTQMSDDLALALGGRWHLYDDSQVRNETGSLRVSMAYRDDESSVVVLDRLEAKYEKQGAIAEEIATQKLIHNLSMHHRLDKKVETALQIGNKYVARTSGGDDTKGWSHFLGLDMQYFVAARWMLGLQGSLLYTQTTRNYSYGWGLYGAYMVHTNMLALVGYNVKGYDDQDFSLQNYRIQGPYLQLKMKVDQDNLREAAQWLVW